MHDVIQNMMNEAGAGNVSLWTATFVHDGPSRLSPFRLSRARQVIRHGPLLHNLDEYTSHGYARFYAVRIWHRWDVISEGEYPDCL